jgi:hypothetical protein
MNNHLNISAVLDEPMLLTEIIEKLASCKKAHQFSREIVHPEWKSINTTTTEVFVSGTVALAVKNNMAPVSMPFNSNFLFTCIREKKGGFKLEWGLSLS